MLNPSDIFVLLLNQIIESIDSCLITWDKD